MGLALGLYGWDELDSGIDIYHGLFWGGKIGIFRQLRHLLWRYRIENRFFFVDFGIIDVFVTRCDFVSRLMDIEGCGSPSSRVTQSLTSGLPSPMTNGPWIVHFAPIHSHAIAHHFALVLKRFVLSCYCLPLSKLFLFIPIPVPSPFHPPYPSSLPPLRPLDRPIDIPISLPTPSSLPSSSSLLPTLRPAYLRKGSVTAVCMYLSIYLSI